MPKSVAMLICLLCRGEYDLQILYLTTMLDHIVKRALGGEQLLRGAHSIE